MTDVFIDDMKLDFEDTGNDAAVGELITAVEKEIKGLRRFIKEVSADNENKWWALPTLQGAFSKHKVADYKEIRIKTMPFDQFALESHETIHEYVRHITNSIKSCISVVRGKGSYEDAFTNIFEGLIEATKTIDALSTGSRAYNMEIFKEDPALYYAEILKNIEALKGARDADDTVLLTDILEYETIPLLERLEEKLFGRTDS
ncbi:MAG: hypothetical protein HY887_04060 [Deltaproteobacteria bacterium]|nr:hypothetical protein [Deltaproteobacteria bacterium]